MLKSLNSFDDMDVFAGVNHTDDNGDLPALTGNETEQELLDYMVLAIFRRIQNRKALKGGYLLNQLLGKQSRMTHDIDFSISSEEDYAVIIKLLREIGDRFIEVGVVSDYKVKESISPTSSGGVDFYAEDGHKVLGVDVGLHSLDWGITYYDFDLIGLDGFSVERMLSDKLIAILSRKRFRRTKDIYDFFILTSNFDFDYVKLREYVKLRGNAEWDNIPFTDVVLREYERAWEKLVLRTVDSGELAKPEFRIVLLRFYTIALPLKEEKAFEIWDHKTLMLR